MAGGDEFFDEFGLAPHEEVRAGQDRRRCRPDPLRMAARLQCIAPKCQST
jgi:hypothetical protein